MPKPTAQEAALEEVSLHIFIGIMVVIRDFYPAFTKAYDHPAAAETSMAIELIWAFYYLLLDLAEQWHGKKFAKHIAGPIKIRLAKKIESDLLPGDADDSLKTDVLKMADTIKKELDGADTEATELGLLPIQALVNIVCTYVKDASSDYQAYVRQQLTRMLTHSVDFKALLADLAKTT